MLAGPPLPCGCNLVAPLGAELSWLVGGGVEKNKDVAFVVVSTIIGGTKQNLAQRDIAKAEVT